MFDETDVREVAMELHEAALQPELWQPALARLGGMLRGAEINLGVMAAAGGPSFLAATLVDPGFHSQMLGRFATPQTNPGLAYMISATPGVLTSRESVMNDRDMLRTDFYQDLLRPHGLWHGSMSLLHRNETQLFAFGAMRRRSAGSMDAAEEWFLARLTPHLHRALRLQQRLQEMEAQVGLAGAILDRSPCGVVVTDAAGRIASANRQAQAILAEADGLLIRGGRLVAAQREEAVRLAQLMRDAAGAPAGRRLRPGGGMQVSRPSARRPLPVAVTRLAAPAPAARHPASVCVAFDDPERVPETDADLLARIYGLTRREARVAALLMQGHSPATACEMLALRMSTVRTHIKHLYLKTGTSRLPELVRLLLRSPAGV